MLDTNLNFNFQSPVQKPSFNKEDLFDVIVIGGGPAGLNAALYSKRKGNHVGIVAGILGGQVMNTSVVENYLGLDTLSGDALVEAFTGHLNTLEVPTLEFVMVEGISSHKNIHSIHLNDGSTIKSKTIILATGSQSRKLGIPGEDELAGRGVAYCAICDAPLYKGKDVMIAGGGNAAVEAAIDLSKVAKSVTILHRSQFRADQILIDQLASKTNVTIHLDTQVLEIVGKDFVTGALVKDKQTNEIREVAGDGFFIEIGHIPNTDTFKDVVEINAHGEVVTDERKRTNIPGIFAAGDMTTVPYKQIIIATAEGATAALAANDYLNTFDTVTKDDEVLV
jgi:alkyl hydroperoxide reductase subunit F